MAHQVEKDKIRQAFATRFRQALEELGCAPTEQRRLQELFGVSGQAVRKWAEGLSMPTAARMPYVASVLGVRRAWLQDGEKPMRPTVGICEESETDRPGELKLNAGEAQMLAWYRMLPEEEQEAVRRILRRLARAR